MPTLFLIPNTISENVSNVFPSSNAQAISSIRTFFVEEPKSARALLKSLDTNFPLSQCQFFDVNEHTSIKQLQDYAVLMAKADAAIISESGCPCVADPGAELVRLAHEKGIDVVPLVGPSSILLALMASGLGGQNFAFNGYLPKSTQERTAKIKALEKRSIQEKQTQIFMETPYRNQHMFEDICKTCDEQTSLSISCDLTGLEPLVKTKRIKEWKNSPVQLPKKPALFIISKSSDN